MNGKCKTLNTKMYSGHFSADFEQRENEKKRIEKAFKESDKKLGVLVKGTVNTPDSYIIFERFIFHRN